MGEQVLKEGYLVKALDSTKHLYNYKKWQRKWFSLDAIGDLSFFENEKNGRPSGLLHLQRCLQVFDPHANGVQLSFCIGLEYDENNYYLKAESAQIFNEWLRLFRRFVVKCELEEISSGLGDRLGSISSVQTRNPSFSTKSKFQRKEGLMAKTGSNNKGWKDRYFILDKGRLSYYRNEKSIHGDPLGTIDLFECSKITKTNGKKGHGFDLHMPSRVFNFSTETETELSEWMAIISHSLGIIADIKGTSPGGGAVLSVHRSGSGASDLSTSSLDRILEGDKVNKSGLLSSQEEEEGEEVKGGAGLQAALISKQEDKDSVVQLLEAEVEAFRCKVSSLEGDLRSSSTVNSQLQEQLVRERREREKVIKELTQEKENLTLQVEQLDKTKEELEAYNDSIQTQLEEQQERTQVLEEEQIVLKHELEVSQNASNSLEEELVDTQGKLQEIEEVARKLEAALKKRGDSEPPSDPLSIQSLNLSYKAKLEESIAHAMSPDSPLLSHRTMDEDPIGSKVHVPGEMVELREKVSELEKERDTLKRNLDELKTVALPVTSSGESPAPDTAVDEERLKWQVEVVNVRRELEGKMEEERRGWGKERAALKQERSELQEKLKHGVSSTQQEVEQLKTKLEKVQQRMVELEGEKSSASERVVQLQAEKEKALADLKTIRKANKSLEKKLSEKEPSAGPNSRPSLSSLGSSLEMTTPEEGSRLAEAEKRISELKTLLSDVEKERDHLKMQLEKLTNSQTVSKASVDVPVASPAFKFLNKTRATVEVSGHSVGGQSQAPPARNGWISASIAEYPPPKPRKPPKELVDRFTMSTSPPPSSTKRQPLSFDEGVSDPPPSIRSRTVSMFQTLFARR